MRHWLLLWLLCTATMLASAAEGNTASAPSPSVSTTAADPSTTDPAQQLLVLLRLPPSHFRPDASYGGGYSDSARNARRRVAGQLAHEHGLALLYDWPMAVIGVDCYVMAVPAGQAVDQVAQRLSGDKRVAWAQPMNVYQARGRNSNTHDDALYTVQPAAGPWHLAELHEHATGRDVRVAVIDSSVDASHPDLAGQLMAHENFASTGADPPEAHGTGVAGIIAARADNGIGIAGIAPGARLMGLRACAQPDARPATCTSLGLAMALNYAITHDASVINMSLSGPADRLLGQLIDAALARGIAVVSAVDRALPGGGFPASHTGVVGVADDRGNTDSGTAILRGAVTAPGRDVPTTQPGQRWAFVSGSSYAAAHVSGLLALLCEMRVPLGPAAATRLVRQTNGGIDACATLSRASGSCSCGCSTTNNPDSIARQ
jgi:subtilisin family serine protease